MPASTRRILKAARTALGAHLRGHEDGITVAIFAVALVVLLGMVALGVDGSRLYDERRQAQNAADHAAIAAALASCDPALSNAERDAAAQSAGLASALVNNYNDNGTTNDVEITAAGSGAEYEYTATVDTTISTTFAQVIGFANISTGATARAMATGCTPGVGGPGAVYAGGTCPSSGKWSFDVSGSNNQVYGGVHANDDVSLGGSGNDFDDPAISDPFTYVGSITGTSGDTFETGYPQDVGPSLPSPVWKAGWDPSNVTGGGGAPPTAGSFLRPYYDLADANGTSDANDTLFTTKVTSVTKDGVYYTTSTEGMDISASSGLRNVVLIAPNGPIKISGSNVEWHPYSNATLPREGILMLSNKVYTGDEACDNYVIAISGSSSDWNGILWGPRGLVEMSGSSNTAVNGSIVGHAVRLNGSGQVIRFDATTSPTDPDVLLLD